ncbi:hypothetical protein LSAT2_032348 [Lamellibrachia satsuma]|nr:hypothetical protein LSAT2_032348 [Lamellibrachia satsuma]
MWLEVVETGLYGGGSVYGAGMWLESYVIDVRRPHYFLRTSTVHLYYSLQLKEELCSDRHRQLRKRNAMESKSAAITTQGTNTGNTGGNVEEKSLEAGECRVKFSARWKGTIQEFFLERPSAKSTFETTAKKLSEALSIIEQTGAAPVMPDGKVGGNGAARLLVDGQSYFMVSKSGKAAGCRMKAYTDMCIVHNFCKTDWAVDYWSCDDTVLPTSDTTLHCAALTADETNGWSERPMAALHGHAVATEEKAKEAGLPCSMEETLFSTPPDMAALLGLLAAYNYPKYKTFIRRGHGFFILGSDVAETLQTFEREIKPYM